MGGYRSGRKRKHHSVYDCVSLDLSFLLKHKMLTGAKLKQGSVITCTTTTTTITNARRSSKDTQHTLTCIAQRYAPGEQGKFSQWDASGHVTYFYGVKQGEQTKTVCKDIPLVTTSPHYGGVRYWYLAPCCGRKCRVLYLPINGGINEIIPECRVCLGLHYATQLQSERDRHITYEKHLLSNWGYWWAQDEYRQLKQHHFKITDEWRYIMARSEFERDLEVMKHLIRAQRTMMRIDIHNLRSIKSEADRLIYLQHLVEQHGASYIIELGHMIGIATKVEDVTAMPEKDFETAFLQAAEDDMPTGDKGKDILSLYDMLQRKKEAEEELERLVLRKAA